MWSRNPTVSLKRRKLAVHLLSPFLLLAVAAILFRGGLLHWFVAIVAFVAACVTLLCAWFLHGFSIGFLNEDRSARWRGWSMQVVRFSTLPLALALSAIPGCLVRTWDIDRGKAFAEVLVPRIDRYQGEHGYLPPNLDAVISPDDQLPGMFRPDSRWQFFVHGKARIDKGDMKLGDSDYEISLPGYELFDRWVLDPKRKVWVYSSM